jgi:hypothetical protein
MAPFDGGHIRYSLLSFWNPKHSSISTKIIFTAFHPPHPTKEMSTTLLPTTTSSSMKRARDDSSMLLSLPELLLTEISSFLDIPDLCRADASCKSFQRANIRVWQQKDESMVSLVRVVLQSEAPTTKERVIKFRTASKKALWYQTLAPIHGPFANSSERCYDCDQYPDLDIRPRDHPERYEFFCRISRKERLILQGFLKWNESSRGMLELPEEVVEDIMVKQEWKQLEPLLQTLTHSSNNNIPSWRIDGIGGLKSAVMSNVSVTLVAVPRASIYQAPTLLICAHMYTGARLQSSPKAYRIFFNSAFVHSHDRDDAVCVHVSPTLCLSIAMSEDEPARLRGFAFL